MAKVRAYIRVAESKDDEYRILASSTPVPGPIVRGGKPLPTASFALDLEIPDSRFRLAEQVLAEIELMEDNVQVNTKVVDI